ncbi:effector-associated domain EAD1-containing protein [Actinoplanes sp. CA-015351]|uniref:effector-associated domain EAD1-containing protein n=1 Tax=Actinoplanes sp. CA-015351 TaxID=3239897 RepID=UPI003D98485F
MTYTELVRRQGFAVLADLYPDEDSVGFLLEEIGLSASDLPPFGRLSAKEHWRAICRILDRGRYVNVDLETLFTEAARQYPGNKSLKELLGSTRNNGELRVLCLSAGPIDENRLRLGAEHRTILEATARSRRPVLAILQPAARARDLVDRVIDAEPQIVHFAGHGDAQGALLLEDDAGRSHPVPVEALGKLLSTVPLLRSVVLTSCFLGAYADLLSSATETVIGSPRPLADECALAFTGPFYKALGEGWTVHDAFRTATAAMDVVGCPPHDLLIEPAA